MREKDREIDIKIFISLFGIVVFTIHSFNRQNILEQSEVYQVLCCSFRKGGGQGSVLAMHLKGKY